MTSAGVMKLCECSSYCESTSDDRLIVKSTSDETDLPHNVSIQIINPSELHLGSFHFHRKDLILGREAAVT